MSEIRTAPDRHLRVADGGFTMLMGDFVTAVKHELPIEVVILKNNVLGPIQWEQRILPGNPKYEVAGHPIDFVKIAEACGGVGFRCERSEEVRPALQSAFSSNEAVVDPFEPAMPARATPQQALKFVESLIRGDPESGKIIKSIFKDKVKEMV